MSTYSTNLKIEEIGTGEQAGTWGTTTNDNFVNVFEEAIVGRVTVPFTDANVTLTATNSVASQSFRNVYLNCTGTNTASRNLVVPTINKNYVVENNTTGGFDIVVKTTAGTGITIPNGKKAAVYVNGTDVVAAFDYFPGTNTFDAPVVISGTTTSAALRITQLGTGDALLVEDSTNPDSSPFVITSTGIVVIGTTTNTTLASGTGNLSVETANSASNISLIRNTANANSGRFLFGKSRSAVAGGFTAVTTGDNLGNIFWEGTDGTSYDASAYISVVVESAVSTGIVPSYMSFATQSTAGALLERMRIDSSGDVGVGVTPSVWTGLGVAIETLGGALLGQGTNNITLFQNTFYSDGYKYKTANFASMYDQNTGSHRWFNAPSGSTTVSAAVTSGQSYTVTTLGSTTLGQWQAFFSALVTLPVVGQAVTATATGSIVGGATVLQIITFTQAMVLNTSGNLGIGTTSPATRLEVSSATGSATPTPTEIRIATTTSASDWSTTLPWGRLSFYSADGSDSGAKIQGSVDFVADLANGGRGSMVFNTSEATTGTLTERMRITSAGDVSIGTTSFGAVKLTVATTNTFDLNNATVTAGINIQQSGGTPGLGNYSTGLTFSKINSSRPYGAIVGVQTTADDDQGGLAFLTHPGSTASDVLVESMRITSAGEMLVGGTENISSAPGTVSIQRTDASAQLNFYRNDTSIIATNILGEINFLGNDTTSNTPISMAYIDAVASGTHAAGDNPTDLVFGTTADNSATVTERMRITSAGNVLIGTTTDAASYKLNVFGRAIFGNSTDMTPTTGWEGQVTILGNAYGGGLALDATGMWVGHNSSTRAIIFATDEIERMRINATGEVGIGTTASGIQLSIDAGANNAIQTVQTGLTAIQMISTDASASGMNVQYFKDSASPAASDNLVLLRFFGDDSAANQQEYGRITTSIVSPTSGSETGQLVLGIAVNGTITNKLVITPTGFTAPEVYTQTTASAANVFVANGGLMSRSTSSIQYKTDVEDLAQPNSANIYNMRPVWYRSTCANDNKDWSWYGLIAEEVAELDPRLVHWGYANDQYDITYIENEGQQEEVKTLKEDAVLQPEGVQYDRLTVLLIQEMKVLKAEMQELKAKVAALEAA